MKLYLWIKRKIFIWKYKRAFKEVFGNADTLYEKFIDACAKELLKSYYEILYDPKRDDK